MKHFLKFFVAVILALSPVSAFAQNAGESNLNGSVMITGAAPSLGACGSSPTGITAGSTAFMGEVTTGTSTTSCVVNLPGSSHTVKPICNVMWEATPLASQSWAVTLSDGVATITTTQTSASNNKFVYQCVYISGGR